MVLTASIKALQRMKMAKPNVPKRQSIFLFTTFRINHVSERKEKRKTSPHQQTAIRRVGNSKNRCLFDMNRFRRALR
jgi:hypothetical protein